MTLYLKEPKADYSYVKEIDSCWIHKECDKEYVKLVMDYIYLGDIAFERPCCTPYREREIRHYFTDFIFNDIRIKIKGDDVYMSRILVNRLKLKRTLMAFLLKNSSEITTHELRNKYRVNLKAFRHFCIRTYKLHFYCTDDVLHVKDWGNALDLLNEKENPSVMKKRPTIPSKKTKTTTFKQSPEDKEMVEKYCKENNISISEFVRMSMSDYIKPQRPNLQ